MDHNLKIPYDKRSHFAKPLDQLLTGSQEDTLLQVENMFKSYKQTVNVYCVGDIVTNNFLSNETLRKDIKICIIDEKTQRKKITLTFEETFEEVIEFENPAGQISKESWPIINKAVKSDKRTLIRITEGEEDLLVIPLILELSSGDPAVKNIVFYGQPPITDADPVIPEGLVMVFVEEKIKEKVRNLTLLMEEV